MARTARSNYAKVKIWTGTMTSEMEGNIAGIALETFSMIPQADRAAALELIQQRHTEISAREEEIAQAQ
jgi:hypothetical protein